MKRMLNREILESRYGIADISDDGYCIVRKNGNYAYLREATTKHQNGKSKTYMIFQAYDKETKRQTNLLVHNCVYAWFNDDYNVDMDIDHRNNISTDNRLENLHQVTRKENLNKNLNASEIQKKTNETKRQKINSGDYVEVDFETYKNIKKVMPSANMFKYTQHYNYVSKEDLEKFNGLDNKVERIPRDYSYATRKYYCPELDKHFNSGKEVKEYFGLSKNAKLYKYIKDNMKIKRRYSLRYEEE